jgi:hypothetical protein
MMSISATDRAAKTRRQMELMEKALTEEFPSLPPNVVHDEFAAVSKKILATARFTDHVAVLTGRYAAAHLQARREAERDVVATTS